MKRTAAVIYIVIFILLAFLSYRQSLHWKDSYSLWSYTVPLQPDSPVARNNLGVYYKDHGQPQLAKQEYELAITYDNSFVPALWNLGMMYLNQGDYEKAFPLLKRMSEIKAPEQYMACRAVGALYLKFYNNPALAKKYFEMSYRLNPNQPDVRTLKMLIEGL
jgi:tetratricopeptide (TPR) repeat protein